MKLPFAEYARYVGLTYPGAMKKAKKDGMRVFKENGKNFIEVPDDFIDKPSDDARYQKARADKMEQEARIAAKKQLALNPEIARRINLEWDEDFLHCFLPLKERIAEILSGLGANKTQIKSVQGLFDTCIENMKNRREKRYEEVLENENAAAN